MKMRTNETLENLSKAVIENYRPIPLLTNISFNLEIFFTTLTLLLR